MNEDKKKSNFFTDKGLYIVLFICVAIIGIASWSIIFSQLNNDKSKEAGVINGSTAGVTEERNGASGKEQEKKENSSETPEVNEYENKTDEPEQEAVSVWQQEEAGTSGGEEDYSDTLGESKYIWPLSGEVEVTYSMSELVYDKTMLDWRTHDGLDIEAKLGTKVMAVMDGTVTDVYTDDMYGMTVVITHANDVESVYSNLAGVPTVNKGDTVSCGDVIGSVGHTAVAETNQVSHLHFAMTAKGESVDPMTYLPNN